MKWLIKVTIFLFVTNLTAQISPVNQWSLPSSIPESSGLLFHNDTFYSQNDGGNPAEIFAMNKQGQIIRKYFLKGVLNNDWEAICFNQNGDLLIGDIGNNYNDRQDLKVLIVKDFFNQQNDTLFADTLSFYYSSQIVYPAIDAQKHFDVESMVVINDSIFLFSKNRSKPYNGFTYKYYLNRGIGLQKAVALDSFYVGSGPKELEWITDTHFSFNTLWLLSHSFVLRFDTFDMKGLRNPKKIFFDSYTQKEGCTYVPPYLYVTDEQHPTVGGGNLYQYLIDEPTNNKQIEVEKVDWYVINDYKLTILNKAGSLQIFDTSGKILLEQKINENQRTVDLSNFKGMYLQLQLVDKKLLFTHRIYLNP